MKRHVGHILDEVKSKIWALTPQQEWGENDLTMQMRPKEVAGKSKEWNRGGEKSDLAGGAYRRSERSVGLANTLDGSVGGLGGPALGRGRLQVPIELPSICD